MTSTFRFSRLLRPPQLQTGPGKSRPEVPKVVVSLTETRDIYSTELWNRPLSRKTGTVLDFPVDRQGFPELNEFITVLETTLKGLLKDGRLYSPVCGSLGPSLFGERGS